MIELFSLGTVDLKDGSRNVSAALAQPKRFALLAYLAAAQPRGFHRRDRLVALFWPELDQEHARTALRKAVHGLRAALGEDAIVGRGAEELGLGPERWVSDVAAFDGAMDAGNYAEALRLYRGDLLDGFFISGAPEFEHWLDGERARLRSRAASAAASRSGASVPDDAGAQRILITAARERATPRDISVSTPISVPSRRGRWWAVGATLLVAIGVWLWWQGTRPPPVTTNSRAAYRAYTVGLASYDHGDFASAESTFAAVVDLDSTFALAAFYAARSAEGRSDDAGYQRYSGLALRQAGHVSERERLLIRATFAEEFGEPEALALADSLVRRHPEEPAGHELLGRALLDEGDFLGAVPHFARVGPDSARSRNALQMMAYAYAMADSLDAAVRTAREWVRFQPASAEAWHQLAGTLEFADRIDEARVASRNAARLRAGDPEDAVFPAVMDFQTGRFADADRQLRDLIRNGPAPIRDRARWDLVISQRNQGRFGDALAEARRYRHTADSAAGGLFNAAPEAQVLFEMGDFRRAAALFDSIARVGPRPESRARAARNRVWYLTHEATALAAAGDTSRLLSLADSIELTGRESAYGRDHLLHYHVLGLLAAARGRPADAAALFARANYSLTGGFSRNNLEWSRALIAIGRPSEAIPMLRGALSGPPDASGLYTTFTEVHELAGRAFDLAGERDSAVVHYQWVLNAWQHADPVLATRREAVRLRLSP